MPVQQLPLPFGPIRNRNLFSNHWLDQRLLLEPEWETYRPRAEQLLSRLAKLWKSQEHRVRSFTEPNLEEKFIQPVLKELGWTLLYQAYLRGRKPDYALFADEHALDLAMQAGRKNPAFWNPALLVADAKAWTVNLDVPAVIDGKREYPPEQIEWYIHHSQKPFGILTNGGIWRLYPHSLASHQSRFATYLECDLSTLLDQWISLGDKKSQRTIHHHLTLVDHCLVFLLFFSPLAHQAFDGRPALIERALSGSNEYRVGIGEGLKDSVFEALRVCAQGFLSLPDNALNPASDLSTCKENSLILLYRLLFIMYAEDRDLLPYRTNRLYRENRSLGRLRDQIAARLDRVASGRNTDYLHTTCDLWADITLLFDLIDRGAKRYGFPAYNGGLFDPDDHPFLTNQRLPDWHLARVIDALGRASDPDNPQAGLFRIDYRDLSIQHLGHVYEGLLELEPHFASEDMLLVRKANGAKHERIIPASAPPPKEYEPTDVHYPKGQVYLATDKGERRATGSYYTPNHIVDYIVERTLGPACNDINKELDKEIASTREALSKARGRNRELLNEKLHTLTNSFGARLCALRILDPAMGSGHFLLRACQYLAEEIATNPHTSDHVPAYLHGDQSILTFWKRHIVEHCIFGVDMNPLAVELAKVALWLETAAATYPLTFLDHHLRCGNSLIGGTVAQLGSLPGLESLPLFEQHASSRLPILLQGLNSIAQEPSQYIEQVKHKITTYRDVVDKVRQPFVTIANLWCSSFFLQPTDHVTPAQYAAALNSLGDQPAYRRLSRQDWFNRSMTAVTSPPVAAFHWELEFPEVFFDMSGRRDDAGFDVIITNPPYDVLSEKETGHDLSSLTRFLQNTPLYKPSFCGKNNLYKLFVCLALSLLRNGGRMGLITPMAILGDKQASSLRRAILESGTFTSVDAFPQKDDPRRRVFPDAKLSTAVTTVLKSHDRYVRSQAFVSRVHPAQYPLEHSPSLNLATDEIPLYDPTNFTIVACSQADWDLAIKITRTGRLGRLGTYAESFQGEINETNARAANHISYNHSDGPEALRGAHVCMYALRTASQGTPIYVRVTNFLSRASADSKAYHHRHARVGFQRKSPQNNFRRLIAALVPAETFLAESVSYIPEHYTSLPLHFILALLNSKLSDWYFRLGSTNAMVSEYQIQNLPCPIFSEHERPDDARFLSLTLAAIETGDLGAVPRLLQPALAASPFSIAVRDIVVNLTERIAALEQNRPEITRRERSALAPSTQPYQDLLDDLFYWMAGLTRAEVADLEARLTTML